ncbi:MAG: 50S ribosomal protein L10 [Oscillospiraceae bacterium]|jgi:large subunit ribosomal protein L10|nr:50S ribosomal protein L10 [Oscillospiraceae bacterium]
MPNAQVLAEKQAEVEKLTAKLKSAAGVLVDYAGITVAEDTEMRAKLRAEQIDYTVVKNTLLRFAAKNVGFEALDPILNGTTSLAVHATDVVVSAKLIKEYSGKLGDRFIIKGGFYDGRIITVAEVESLAAIPPLPQLQAQLLGTMLAPISQLALVIKLIAEQNGAVSAPAETVAEAAAEAAVPADAPVAESAPVEEAAPAEAAAEADAPVAEVPVEEPPAAE